MVFNDYVKGGGSNMLGSDYILYIKYVDTQIY